MDGGKQLYVIGCKKVFPFSMRETQVCMLGCFSFDRLVQGGLHQDGCSKVMDISSRRKRPMNMHGEFVYNNIIPMQPEYLRAPIHLQSDAVQNWIDLEKKCYKVQLTII